MSAITRRTALKAAPAVALAAAVPAVATAETLSPFPALYAAWREQKARVNSTDIDSPEYEALFDRLIEIERTAGATPATSILDYAYKIVFADDDGGMSMNKAQVALADEAKAMIGAAPGATPPESELMRRFRECVAYRAWFNRRGAPDDEDGSQISVLHRMEAGVCALPARTLQELAAKMTIWSSYGDANYDGELDDLVVPEFLSLAGFPAHDSRLAPAPQESEIMRLFREWQWLFDNDPPGVADLVADDAIMSAHTDRMVALADRMLALPSTSPADFAAKLLAYTNYGDFDLDGDGAPVLYAEAATLAGVDPSRLFPSGFNGLAT